jgi:hypothetical protein
VAIAPRSVRKGVAGHHAATTRAGLAATYPPDSGELPLLVSSSVMGYLVHSNGADEIVTSMSRVLGGNLPL